MKRRKFILNNSTFIASLPLMNFMPGFGFDTMDSDTYQFKIGKFDCTIFKDFMFNYQAKDYFINADKDKLQSGLKKHGIATGKIPSPYISMLLQDGDRNILIDSGIGFSEKPIVFKGKEFVLNGQLSNLLAERGVDRNTITDVVITHFHPDHIGGIYTGAGQLSYPNATFHVHQREWDYWHSSKSDNQPQLFKFFIEKNITPLKAHKLKMIKEDYHKIYDDLVSVNAEGHTEGQIGLMIGNGKDQLLYISDSFLHPLHIEKLDWRTNYDMDHEIAKKTRMKLLDLAYGNGMRINAFHFDFPGLGRIEKNNLTWRWLYDK